ncbi:MAG: FtsX-like permease family protein, partial [Spirochaetota bacterium]|nr:FtsX-like permease family protein [Spirochaetota bacterium]
MLGEVLAQELDYRVQDEIWLSENEVFPVAGIFKSGSKIIDSSVVMEMGEAERILKRNDSINIALLRLKPAQAPQTVTADIEKHFPNLSTSRSGDFVGHIRLLNVVDVFAWAISIVALIASCLVVMNTLLMAVFEQTKEIGILMAIGWSPLMIATNIVQEALALCTAGWIFGSLSGFLSLLLLQ